MDGNIKVGLFSNEKLESSGVRTIKNQVLLAPGVWNGRNYTSEEIEKAFEKTDWNDKDVISLIADHNDDDSKGRPLTIRDWLGYVSNQRMDTTRPGYVIGDLNLCDSDLATKLIEGKANFGISPFVFGRFDTLSQSQRDFVFKNFAVVVEPACKESYINSYLSDDELNTSIKDLNMDERIKLRTAKLAETTSSDVSGSPVESKGLQPIDYKKKKKKVGPGGHVPDGSGPNGSGAGPGEGKADGSGMKNESDLKELKGDKKNMAENEEIETEKVESEEVKEEVKEEEKVEKTEEPKEEVAEEVVAEEESEEKLLDNIAKMTEKLLSKRKMTPEQSKLNAIEKEVSLLKSKVAKLEEEKAEEPESKEDTSKEKLSAKAKSVAGTKLEEDHSFAFGKTTSMNGSRELAAMMNLI